RYSDAAADRRSVHFIAPGRWRGDQAKRALDRLIRDFNNIRAEPCRLGSLRLGAAWLSACRGTRLVLARDSVQAWRRWHFDAVRPAHAVHHANLHRRILDPDPAPGEGGHDHLPGDGDADGWRLRGARPGALLPLLRGRPHPDVHHHWHLGPREPRVRRLQVFSLHVHRVGADAARDHGHVLDGGYNRHHGAAQDSLFTPNADLAVARVLPPPRGQDCHVG